MAKLIPSFEDFEAGHAAGRNQLVYARLAADLDTPVSLMLKLAEARTDSFMLESVTGGEVRGRYSIVGMKPDLVWRCRDGRAEINRDARFDPGAFSADTRAPPDSLRGVIAESRVATPADIPHPAARLFGHLGYGRSWHRSQARIAGSRRRRVKLTSDDGVSAAECAAPIRQFVSRDVGIPPPLQKTVRGYSPESNFALYAILISCRWRRRTSRPFP